jgi:CheY-like chemotaxis protein
MKKPTILYIDDDVHGLTAREWLLRQRGYDVLITTSGRQGVELFRSVPVDAVILDYWMPEMMGDKVAASMKQVKPEVPIMLLSADDGLPQDALRSTDTFLSKSLPPGRFVVAVDELLEARSPFFQRWFQGWKRRLTA